MSKYKIKTDEGIEVIELDKELEEGDKGFIMDGRIAVLDEGKIFRIIGKGDKIEKSENNEVYEIDELSKEDEKQYVLGQVLVPDMVDSQGDVISKGEIEKAAWRFLSRNHAVGYRHEEYAPNSYVVESYLAPTDMEIKGETIKAGTWLLGVKFGDEVWKEIKEEKIKSFSIGGWADRVPVKYSKLTETLNCI